MIKICRSGKKRRIGERILMNMCEVLKVNMYKEYSR